MKLAILGYGLIARQHMRALGALRERGEEPALGFEWVMGRVAASAAVSGRAVGLPWPRSRSLKTRWQRGLRVEGTARR